MELNEVSLLKIQGKLHKMVLIYHAFSKKSIKLAKLSTRVSNYQNVAMSGIPSGFAVNSWRNPHHVTSTWRVPLGVNSEPWRNTQNCNVLIVGYPQSTVLLIWYLFLKTRDSSVLFCEVFPKIQRLKNGKKESIHSPSIFCIYSIFALVYLSLIYWP
jgi:hypothetical protein